MRRGGLFWGLLLILLGGLFLLDNFGILDINVWQIFLPAVLIVLGLSVLYGALFRRRGADVTLAIPLEGAESGKIKVEYGAGRLRVGGGAPSGHLVSGTFYGGVDYDVRKQGGALDVRLESNMTYVFPFGWSGDQREWTVNLSPAVPLSLDFEVGAAETRIDLTELKVGNLRLQTGASSTEIQMPARAGHTWAKISSGAASVEICIPEGVAARIKASGALADVQVNTSRFPRGEGGYQSPDFATAANRVEIEAETGVGALKIM